jgi:predicted nucleic acid-binding protein
VIEIRQANRIKLPDAIIAATALQNSAILVTRNTKDFKTLALETYNPFDSD